MFNSHVSHRSNNVPFPEFKGVRVHMLPFNLKTGLPNELSHFQPTVDAMLEGVDAEIAYLMIDQLFVSANQYHRRSGLHVDGYWKASRHSHVIPTEPGGREKEAIILASNITGSVAFKGDWTGEIGEGGDCSHICTNHLVPVILTAGNVYAGNVTMLHKSIPVHSDSYRTVVRLNVPGWEP